MKQPGQVVLFRFPQTDLNEGKLRPAVLIKKVPSQYDDWLVCMVSSQLRHFDPDFDEIVRDSDDDYSTSGLKVASVIRIGRMAVVDESILVGSIGEISSERLTRITDRLASWLKSDL